MAYDLDVDFVQQGKKYFKKNKSVNSEILLEL